MAGSPDAPSSGDIYSPALVPLVSADIVLKVTDIPQELTNKLRTMSDIYIVGAWCLST